MPGPGFRRGDRVALRPVEREDVVFLRRWWNAPAVRRRLPASRPVDEAAAEERFEEWLSDEAMPTFLVTPAADDDRRGFCHLFDVGDDNGRAKVSAWLKPDAQGRGYGVAAVRQLVAYAFEERRLERLSAGVLADNDAARATLEAAGFRQEGRQRGHSFVESERVDRVLYGLLREEWEG